MIVDEVRESARGLHERLIAKLKGPIQLPTCLQVTMWSNFLLCTWRMYGGVNGPYECFVYW